MTRGSIVTEISNLRFSGADATRTAQIQNWVGSAEVSIWNADDWVFKRVIGTNLSVTSGSRTVTMPTDFNRAIRVYDNNGSRLDYRQPDLFEEFYPAATTGAPEAYTVINRQIYLGPTPNASVTFKLSYERRYAHLNNVAAVVAGVMTVDTDTPIWDAEYHYVLVHEAALIGGNLLSDLDAAQLQSNRDELLAAMRASLVSGVKEEVVSQAPTRVAPQPKADAGAGVL